MRRLSVPASLGVESRRMSTTLDAYRRQSLQTMDHRTRRQSKALLQCSPYLEAKISEKKSKLPTMENSYKMGPTLKDVFKPDAARNQIKEVIEKELSNKDYSYAGSKALTCRIAEEVKEAVKNIVSDRYKLVCHVVLGSDNGQSVHSVSRCLWNTDFDNMATFTQQHNSWFAICSVYAIDYE